MMNWKHASLSLALLLGLAPGFAQRSRKNVRAQKTEQNQVIEGVQLGLDLASEGLDNTPAASGEVNLVGVALNVSKRYRLSGLVNASTGIGLDYLAGDDTVDGTELNLRTANIGIEQTVGLAFEANNMIIRPFAVVGFDAGIYQQEIGDTGRGFDYTRSGLSYGAGIEFAPIERISIIAQYRTGSSEFELDNDRFELEAADVDQSVLMLGMGVNF